MSLGHFLRLLVRHGQKFLVYPSAFAEYPREIILPSWLGLPYEDLELHTTDNVTLRCFLFRMTTSRNSNPVSSSQILENEQVENTKKLARATVIMFHGNGMNHSDLVESAKEFFELSCNVITLSYRGYGNSDGSPSEKGLRRDAQAAIDFVLRDPGLSQTPIILYGTSLGGAVAIDLASRNPSKISALIVENTFISLPAVVRDWPVVGPLSFLCTQKWNSGSKLPRIPTTVPILMLSGLSDQVVPPKHMRTLWEIASQRGVKTKKELTTYSPPGKDIFKSFESGQHHDTYIQDNYWNYVEEFISDVVSENAE